jgi:hypothetical protein
MSENLTQLVAETASLGWFKQLGCAVHLGTQLASGGSAAEREVFSDVVLGLVCTRPSARSTRSVPRLRKQPLHNLQQFNPVAG